MYRDVSISPEQLITIRKRIDDGETVASLAAEFGLSYFCLRSRLIAANLYPDFSKLKPFERTKPKTGEKDREAVYFHVQRVDFLPTSSTKHLRWHP